MSFAKIITVFNEKGGSGKTTLSCQLANALGRRCGSVLLADLDRQATSLTWSTFADGKNFRAKTLDGVEAGDRLVDTIGEMGNKFDFIIADCAPSVDQPGTWGMLLISDLALIPTRLSPPDLAALKAAKLLAKRALETLQKQKQPRTYPIRVVANAVRMHMEDDKEYLQQLSADRDFKLLNTTISERRAYQRSMLMGASVHAVPNSREAIKEIEALTDEVVKVLKVKPSLKVTA